MTYSHMKHKTNHFYLSLLYFYIFWLKLRLYAVVAEWLRRQTRNLLGSARAGSNPADCEMLFWHLFPKYITDWSLDAWRRHWALTVCNFIWYNVCVNGNWFNTHCDYEIYFKLSSIIKNLAQDNLPWVTIDFYANYLYDNWILLFASRYLPHLKGWITCVSVWLIFGLKNSIKNKNDIKKVYTWRIRVSIPVPLTC